MLHRLLAPITAAFLALCGPGPASAETFVLTPAQMISEAARALAAHQPSATLALTQAVLAQFPDNLSALLLQTRALRDLGRNDAAITTGQRAWQVAQTPQQKFPVAIVMAQATSSAGQRTKAQVWLRRAAQNAETDHARALVRRDFAYVRERNPWRMHLDFGASPSSNVNGGSAEDTITLFGLPFDLSPDAQALSGYQAHGAVDLAYRFAEGERTQSWIGLQAYTRKVWLSDEARAAVPDVAEGSYDYQSVALTLRHDRDLREAGRQLSFSANVGRNWYGGALLSDFASLGVKYRAPLPKGARLTLSARGDVQQNATPDAPVLAIADIGVEFLQPIARRDALAFTFGLRRAMSDDVFSAFSQTSLGVEYSLGKPVLGTRVSLGAALSRKSYPVSRYTLTGRQDDGVSLHAEMQFTGLDYFGFSPTLRLEHNRVRSNVTLYTSETNSLALGFRSNF